MVILAFAVGGNYILNRPSTSSPRVTSLPTPPVAAAINPRDIEEAARKGASEGATGALSKLPVPTVASLPKAAKQQPIIGVDYKLMPFDPPYPPDTVIAGIHFKPKTFDVRLYMSIKHAPVVSLGVYVQLVNTSGQMLPITGMGQRTQFKCTVDPVILHDGTIPDSMTLVNKDGTLSTIPSGSKSSVGMFEDDTDMWRIHCDDLLADSMPEFVLMVTRPYREPWMIEGFVVKGDYIYQNEDSPKKAFWSMSKCDSTGKSYVASEEESKAIVSKLPYLGLDKIAPGQGRTFIGGPK